MDSVCGLGEALTGTRACAPLQVAALSSSGLEMLKKAICTLRKKGLCSVSYKTSGINSSVSPPSPRSRMQQDDREIDMSSGDKRCCHQPLDLEAGQSGFKSRCVTWGKLFNPSVPLPACDLDASPTQPWRLTSDV